MESRLMDIWSRYAAQRVEQGAAIYARARCPSDLRPQQRAENRREKMRTLKFRAAGDSDLTPEAKSFLRQQRNGRRPKRAAAKAAGCSTETYEPRVHSRRPELAGLSRSEYQAAYAKLRRAERGSGLHCIPV